MEAKKLALTLLALLLFGLAAWAVETIVERNCESSKDIRTMTDYERDQANPPWRWLQEAIRIAVVGMVLWFACVVVFMAGSYVNLVLRGLR